MSDSEKTDELDNYGVRVKKDADSAAPGPADFSLDAELPDLSSLSAPGTGTDAAEEDISLDEFIAGGEFADVAEGNRGYGQAEAPAQPEAADGFGMDSPDDAAESAGDAPLDIDLSFDDSADGLAAEYTESAAAEEPAAETAPAPDAGTESVDLSMFGFDGGTADEQPAAETAPTAGAESMDSFDDMFSALGDGGTMDASAFFDEEPSETPAESAPAPASPSAPTGEETVDLSDFGFDDSSTESQGEVKDGTKKAVAQEDYEMTVTADDDEPSPSVPMPQEGAAADAAPVTESAAASGTGETTNTLLSKIVGELDSLRNEIAQLKNDFAAMQAKGIPTPAMEAGKTAEHEDGGVPEIPAPEQETGGFFDGSAEDETISLSTDELSSIMGDADFQTESAEAENEADGTQAEDAAEPTEAAPDAGIPEIPAAEQETGGFFDGSIEDETISLSTDELSSIMGDADFQTESAEAESEADGTQENADFGPDAPVQEETPDLPDEIFVPKTDGAADGAPLPEEPAPVPESEPIAVADEPSSADAAGTPADDTAREPEAAAEDGGLPGDLKQEIRSVLSYMDRLLENLPEEKIAEFAQSEQFEAYKKLFKELGLA